MRYHGTTVPVHQQCIEEADFDLDLLQRRLDNLRMTLHAACQDTESVSSRLACVTPTTKAHSAARARAQEMLAACRAACIHLDPVTTTSGNPPPTPAGNPAAAARVDATAHSSATADSSCSTATALHQIAADHEDSGTSTALRANTHTAAARHQQPVFRAPAPAAAAARSQKPGARYTDLGRLKLARPLVAFDLETTGLDTKHDRIVEFAAVRVEPDGATCTLRHLLDPGVPMPPAAAATHRITDAHVRGKPCFAAVAAEIHRHFDDADILGYNALRFDVPLLAAEFARAAASRSSSGAANSAGHSRSFQFPPSGARVIDAYVVWKRSHNFRLASAHRHFCGADMRDAHTALADATATLQVLLGQLRYYPALADTVPALQELCSAPPKVKPLDPERRFQWLDGQAAFAFGKHKGFALAQVAAVDAKYMEWLANRDFGQKANRIIAEAQQGVFPQPPEAA